MRIFGISDLHLSLGVDKPMHVFGDHWKDHHLKIERAWRERTSLLRLRSLVAAGALEFAS